MGATKNVDGPCEADELSEELHVSEFKHRWNLLPEALEIWLEFFQIAKAYTFTIVEKN